MVGASLTATGVTDSGCRVWSSSESNVIIVLWQICDDNSRGGEHASILWVACSSRVADMPPTEPLAVRR